jgi:hypothetical protein
MEYQEQDPVPGLEYAAIMNDRLDRLDALDREMREVPRELRDELLAVMTKLMCTTEAGTELFRVSVEFGSAVARANQTERELAEDV